MHVKMLTLKTKTMLYIVWIFNLVGFTFENMKKIGKG